MNIAPQSAVIVYGEPAGTFFDMLVEFEAPTVVVPEGRPDLTAARQTCAALQERGITPIVIADNMAGFLFYRGLVREVWLACRKTDSEGAWCACGAGILAVLGRKHNVPVYLYPEGLRHPGKAQDRDLFYFNGKRIAPANVPTYVPSGERVARAYITPIEERPGALAVV